MKKKRLPISLKHSKMTRTLIITLLLSVSMYIPIHGQINFTFSSGLNYSTCDFNNYVHLSSRPRLGYFFGVAPGYQYNKIKFLTHFQYSRKGFRPGPVETAVVLEYRFTYLDIIPEIEYDLFKFLTLGVGINYGVKLNEEVRFESDNEWKDDLNDNWELIKSTDFGVVAKLKFTYKDIFGFIRYNHGLKNIGHVMYTDLFGALKTEVNQMNRNWQIGIGHTLKLKKK